MMTESQTATDGHKQELGILVYRSAQNTNHTYIKMTIPKTKVAIVIMEQNDVTMGCAVFRMPF